jgi:glycosyltransferase involved in cell wall biosynthesis
MISKDFFVCQDVSQNANLQFTNSQVNKAKRLSIVITSYSIARSGDLKDIIESIRKQTYPYIELVLIIEGSQSLYKAVASYLQKNKLPETKVIFKINNIGLSAARNIGFQASSGEVIAFVDDDVVLEPNWAEEVVKAYDDPTIIGTTGSSEPMWIGRSLTWLPEEFYWLIGSSAFADFNSVTEVRNAWGWGMSFRRDVFDKGCRFNESYGYRAGAKEAWGQRPPEDVDLSLKARARTGGRIVYVPSIRLKHKVHPYRFTVRLIAEKAFYSGRAQRMTSILYQDLNLDLLTIEKSLLRRILVNTFPKILRSMVKKPVEAWHQLSISVIILFLVFLGFCTYH